MSSEPYLDHQVYLHPAFSPHQLSASILAGESYHPSDPTPSTSALAPAVGSDFRPTSRRGSNVSGLERERESKVDISLTLARLNFGIDEVTRQLKAEITTHHTSLLSLSSTTTHLSTSLTQVRHGLTQVSLSLERLRLKIRVPHQTLQTSVTRLSHLQKAQDVLRRTHRFILVARRLELQIGEMISTADEEEKAEGEGRKERAMNKAAISIAEMESLLAYPLKPSAEEQETASTEERPIPLTAINQVTRYLPVLQISKETLVSEMENQVFKGLSKLNQPILASALQTAFNLGLLPSLVSSLLGDLTEAVESRIKKTFDPSQLAKEAGLKEVAPSDTSGYKYRSSGNASGKNEPTPQNAQLWANALWARMSNLIEDMVECCIKVYILEKVLKVKKDPASGVAFLDEAMKVLDNKPSYTFWTTLARTLETQSKEAARSSGFIQQTLSAGYPRLLRLFHQFFAKISVLTDTVYTQNQQSPETVLLLRSLSTFENQYLTRSTGRVNEVVSNAFAGGIRSPPGANEGLAIARVITNELDSAKFDPLLLRSVARNVGVALGGFRSRMDNLLITDNAAYTMTGTSETSAQVLNAQLTSALYHCHSAVGKIEGEYNERVMNLLRPSILELEKLYKKHTADLLGAIRREFSNTLGRLHRVDYADGAKEADGSMMSMGGASSPYMKDLQERMSFVRTRILAPYNVGPLKKEWTVELVRYIIQTFVLHASIVSPLGESGKLRLTSDMTELEFSLGTFLLAASGNDRRNALKIQDIGEAYLCLRAFRPFLFLETCLLSDPARTVHLPALVVSHHILVRSPLSLPHQQHGWSEGEYVRWVEAHTEPEAWALVQKGVAQAVNNKNQPGDDEGSGLADVEQAIDAVLREARAQLGL
ncbi:Predicted Golgi transport complex 1 protein [Phaffia rhodozyma]|uniref:Conserved oligomeric Golgi complex subunit 5 n=1 Tax=Phaffia rhodozyma TaxID=264483 RepID=A0A0F7SE45_PHARH|nr:Predicted Golgi transport complex 1 protein [Phaffia rhodozyma]